MKKILFLIIIFCVSSCGYQPIYLKIDNDQKVFKNIELLGDKKINRTIYAAMSLETDSQNEELNEIIISSEKKINETSKNSKGDVLTYKMTLNINIKIKDNQTIRERNFSKSFSYNTKDNKFDLNEYQNQIEKNIIDDLIRDIIIFIRL
tara:strand:- start:487 stop:933 length:447 start_codon:yes stop_codon:yes gene_type:complete